MNRALEIGGIVAAGTLLSVCGVTLHADAQSVASVSGLKAAKGRVIVKFKDGAAIPAGLLPEGSSSATPARANKRAKVKSIRPLFDKLHAKLIKHRHGRRSLRVSSDTAIPNLSSFYLLGVPVDTDIKKFCEPYISDPRVELCQPDYLVKKDFSPNDPLYYNLWGLQIIEASQAWDIAQGDGVVVAVVDTGLDYNHPDIQLNVWTNPFEIDGNGLDDDQNGYIDDYHGFDFAYSVDANGDGDYNDPGDISDADPMDGDGHGTHVAGIIAAVGNNNEGTIGVAHRALIMPVKGLDDSGNGYSSDLARAIVYAAANGADVINNSWGCPSRCPRLSVVESAVRTAYGLGAIVVFAAGNENDDVAYYSPQNMDETIAVAASTVKDVRASFSNYGALIDVAAPGTTIQSLLPGGIYGYASGTSAAAPHASGLVALILSHNGALTYDQVRAIIRSSADDIEDPGFDVYSGYGRINALKALTFNAPPPNEPPVLDPIGNKTVTVGHLLEFIVSATDPNAGDTLTFSATGLPAGALFDPATQTFSWIPLAGQENPGYKVTFTVTDPGDLSDSEEINIAVAPSPQPATLVLTAVADTYVSSKAPSKNFGTRKRLRVRRGRRGALNVAYFKFSIPAFVGQIVSARLRLHSAKSTADGGEVVHVTDSNWQEYKMNYNNRSALDGARFGSIGRVRRGQWVEKDVTGSVSSSGFISFALKKSSLCAAVYHSRERKRFKPQLILQIQ